MGQVILYLLYAAVFIAVVLAVEGTALVVRGLAGPEATINRRLQRAQGRQAERASTSDQLDAFVAARLPWLAAAVKRSGVQLSAGGLLLLSLTLTVSTLAVLTVIGAPLLVAPAAALVLGVGFPLGLVSVLARARQKRFLNQLPDAVDLIARSLQAGHPVATAMSVVSKQMPRPIGPEFGVVIQEMTYGLDRDEALKNLLQRFPMAELRMFVASLEVTRESGGNLAEVFIKLAAAIRAKAMLRKKVEAVSAEGRMSFWVVSGLPFAVVGMLLVLNPAYYVDVAGDPLFWPMMLAAPVLLAIGATIIWRMVNFRI